jgi:hypothetical protein
VPGCHHRLPGWRALQPVDLPAARLHLDAHRVDVDVGPARALAQQGPPRITQHPLFGNRGHASRQALEGGAGARRRIAVAGHAEVLAGLEPGQVQGLGQDHPGPGHASAAGAPDRGRS